MKLSEAIREGAKLGPQHFGEMFRTSIDDHYKRVVYSCALGAAALASGCTLRNAITIVVEPLTFEQKFPILERAMPLELDPFKDGPPRRVGVNQAIAILNDSKQWTREAIAMWVESVENYFEHQDAQVKAEVSEKALVNA